MATAADIQWVRERIDPEEWSVFIKLGYAGTALEAVNLAATAALDTEADYDKRDALADLLEMLDAQVKFNSVSISDAGGGQTRSGPRYMERIAKLRQQTAEGPGVPGSFEQVEVTYHAGTTWDEYAHEE